MPTLLNDGIQIYYETYGDVTKPPLVFNHGNGNSLENWKQFGYVDYLKNYFYLILVDARGFGKSAKSHDKDDYTAEKIVSDFMMVLDHLHIEKVHYFGNSRGARMAFAFQALQPNRFLSFTICAANPESDKVSQFFIPWLERGMPYFIDQLEAAMQRKMPQLLKETFLANDHLAMIAANQMSFSFPDVFEESDTPCLLIVGTKDSIYHAVKESVSTFKNVQLEEIEEYTHLETYIDGETIASLTYHFIKSEYPKDFS